MSIFKQPYELEIIMPNQKIRKMNRKKLNNFLWVQVQIKENIDSTTCKILYLEGRN